MNAKPPGVPCTVLALVPGQKVRQRGSSFKLQVLKTALMTALADTTFDGLAVDPDRRGRLVESSVGAHLCNSARGTSIDVQYWLHRNREVDFVLVWGKQAVAIEVKSGQRKAHLPGLAAFAGTFPVKRQLLVGAQGIPPQDFLRQPASYWMEG